MLEHLEIKNFALIENLVVDFSDGFNVITGETGSGKSIILGALGLLMGEKAEASAIRNGADEIIVNAIVSIPQDHEIISWLKDRDIEPEDGQIIIKRTVKSNGRSAISVQGQLITRSELTYLADSVIDMHGQSEHQSLLLSDKQRRIVDSYAQSQDMLDKCSSFFHKINECKKRREEILEQINEGRKQEDYLKFALEEIKGVSIREGEDAELKERIGVINQFETIYDNLQLASEKLKEINALYYDATAFSAKASKCDNKLAEYTSRLESLRIENEDIFQGMKEYVSNIDYSEEAVNQMQEKLAFIQKLKRKYGPEISDVLNFAENAQAKLKLASCSEDALADCENELEKALTSYKTASENLSVKRRVAASELEKKIENTLRALGMPNAQFKICVNTVGDKISQYGSDEIVFMISPNPGEDLKEMKEIVSGGELSRIMLSLKTVLAKADSIQTQVFDEVDSGIGGSVALSLASCIQDLAQSKQVIVITHLAAIAAKAKNQFVVTKTVDRGRTYSHLKEVTGEDRVHEIARMLSGDESDITLTHARSLLS